jgi:hypothetical protein
MVEATRWSSCGVGWLGLWGSLGARTQTLAMGQYHLAGLTPAPSIAMSELPRQYDLIRVVAFGSAVMASGSLTHLMGCIIGASDRY